MINIYYLCYIHTQSIQAYSHIYIICNYMVYNINYSYIYIHIHVILIPYILSIIIQYIINIYYLLYINVYIYSINTLTSYLYITYNYVLSIVNIYFCYILKCMLLIYSCSCLYIIYNYILSIINIYYFHCIFALTAQLYSQSHLYLFFTFILHVHLQWYATSTSLQLQNIFHCPQKKCPLVSSDPSSPSPALTTMNTLSVSMNLPVLGASYKWNSALCALCDIASLTQHLVFQRFIHLIAFNQYFIPLYGCFCDLNVALKCYLFSLLLFILLTGFLACPLIFVPEAVSHSPYPVSIW